ncbi:hypothetical protein BKI52_40470 [marine bacterium AO1-C]|nr:hypothetical protein BKI52_40470 [marine bacterium AO1-C]
MKTLLPLCLCLVWLSLTSNAQTKKPWKGQAPIQKVSTATKPVQKQYKGVFELSNGVYCSNDFAGARLNGVVANNDTLITILITPENTPINFSPWYAFKIWAKKSRPMYVRITYLEGVRHRYYPKLSRNGKDWTSLHNRLYFPGKAIKAKGSRPLPAEVTMRLDLTREPLWVAAQEIMTSSDDNAWSDKLSKLPFVTKRVIGKSREGRPLHLLKIGKANDKKMIMVLSRQHPPEVTGYLCMRAFIETICSDRPIAKKFRKVYNTYLVPMVNPDGVDNGHWRHGMGGIDLNRDWQAANQPETQAVQKFMREIKARKGGKFYFGVDFHSTWEDIYYTVDPKLKGNMPGLVPKMIKAAAAEIKNYEPNIRPSMKSGSAYVTSARYFFWKHQAEALTFEIGDHTPRALIKKKGQFAAIKLMELMLKEK